MHELYTHHFRHCACPMDEKIAKKLIAQVSLVVKLILLGTKILLSEVLGNFLFFFDGFELLSGFIY